MLPNTCLYFKKRILSLCFIGAFSFLKLHSNIIVLPFCHSKQSIALPAMQDMHIMLQNIINPCVGIQSNKSKYFICEMPNKMSYLVQNNAKLFVESSYAVLQDSVEINCALKAVFFQNKNITLIKAKKYSIANLQHIISDLLDTLSSNSLFVSVKSCFNKRNIPKINEKRPLPVSDSVLTQICEEMIYLNMAEEAANITESAYGSFKKTKITVMLYLDVLFMQKNYFKALCTIKENEVLFEPDELNTWQIACLQGYSPHWFFSTDERKIQWFNDLDNSQKKSLKYSWQKINNTQFNKNISLEAIQFFFQTDLISLHNIKDYELKLLSSLQNVKTVYINNSKIKNSDFVQYLSGVKRIVFYRSKVSREVLEQLEKQNIEVDISA